MLPGVAFSAIFCVGLVQDIYRHDLSGVSWGSDYTVQLQPVDAFEQGEESDPDDRHSGYGDEIAVLPV